MLCVILRTHLAKDCSSSQIVISGCKPTVIQIGQDVQSLEVNHRLLCLPWPLISLMEIETSENSVAFFS